MKYKSVEPNRLRCYSGGTLNHMRSRAMVKQVSARLIVSILTYITCSITSFSLETVYSKINIPPHCEFAYKSGSSDLQKSIKDGNNISDKNWLIPHLDENISKHNESCAFFYSVGFYDSLSLFQQMIAMELALEIDDALKNRKNAHYLEDILEIYDQRFNQAGMSPQLATKIVNDKNFRTASLKKLEEQLNEISNDRGEAVPYGRFVFVGLENTRFSIYEYKQKRDGSIVKSRNNQEVLVTGTYQKTAERIFKRSSNILKDYMNWEPSLFFGEDSLWRGSWVSYFQKTPPKSLREIKQEGYEKPMRRIREFARRLKLDTRPFLKLESILVAKERSFLKRDLSAYEAMAEHWYAPLLVPVGMYAGSALLVKTGWFAATTATSAQYVGGSLALGANASAAISLGVITGMSAHGVYVGYSQAKNSPNGFNFTKVLDYAAVSAMQSFSLAASLPVITGATLLGGQKLFIGTRALLGRSIQVGQTIKTLGVRGSIQSAKSFIVQLPGHAVKLPQTVFKAWLKAWYKNPKFLLTSYGVDIALTTIFDCGYRQVTQKGEKKCVYSNENDSRTINKQFLYSLGSTIVIGVVSKPMIFIKSPVNRFFAYRGLDLFASTLSQIVISHETDPRRVVFDQFFGTTFGTAFGEVNRSLVLSDYVQNKGPAKQALLIFAIKAILMSPAKSAIKVYLTDEYVADEKEASEIVRKLLWSEANLSTEGFDDQEIIGALTDLRESLKETSLLESI